MQTSKKMVVLGLSGGMDSATLLAFYLARGYEVHCFSFTYGSKHNQFENEAARDIVAAYQEKNYPVKLIENDISNLFTVLNSALLLNSNEEIPEGHYEQENMKKTVVPGRNLIFASIMAAYAESIGAEVVALGVHSGDHAIYPDCRPDFVKNLGQTIMASSDNKVSIQAPFIDFDKAAVLGIGIILETDNTPVFYNLTRTCYKNQPLACGKCGSCQERLEAFEMHNMKDPVKYE